MKKRQMAVSILLLAVLIAGACFLPQLVLEIQDSFLMRATRTEERTGIDFENMNLSYEMSVSKRLENFASQKEGYFAMGTKMALTGTSDMQTAAEHYDMVDKLVYGDFLMSMLSLNMFPDILEAVYRGYNLDTLKKYVIYNEESNDGVAIMAWYAKLLLQGYGQLELLWDARTDTVYYVKFCNVVSESDKFDREMRYLPDTNRTVDQKAEIYGLEARTPEFLFYCADYYESDFEKQLKLIQSGEYVLEEAISEDGRNTVKIKEENSETLMFSLQYESTDVGNCYMQTVNFSFGEQFLEFSEQFLEDYGDGYHMELSFGILEIGRLIPEFGENQAFAG